MSFTLKPPASSFSSLFNGSISIDTFQALHKKNEKESSHVMCFNFTYCNKDDVLSLNK